MNTWDSEIPEGFPRLQQAEFSEKRLKGGDGINSSAYIDRPVLGEIQFQMLREPIKSKQSDNTPGNL